MNDIILEEKLNTAIWVSHNLFQRQKASGSSANISFLHGTHIYISRSGSCFGNMQKQDFAVIEFDGTSAGSIRPSKEWPLHLSLYGKSAEIGAVIHTHSVYSVLLSFLPDLPENDCIPPYTPYLKMKLGNVGLIPYEQPGSPALFEAFDARVQDSDGFLLKQHGPVVPGKTILDAFYALEELEDSARIAWEIRRAGLDF